MQAKQSPRNARIRTVGAMAALLMFWGVAYFCVVLAVAVPLGNFDGLGNMSWQWVGPVATVVAVVLCLASGPASYAVARRRFFLGSSLLGAAAALVIVVALT